MSKYTALPSISLFILIFSMACTSNHSNRAPKQDSTLYYLTSGLAVKFDKGNAHQIVSKKMGFQYIHIGGCEVTQHDLDSFQTNNHQVDSLLALKYGANWKIQYDKAVEEEDSIEQLVLQLIDTLAIVENAKTSLIAGEELSLYFQSVNTDGSYVITGRVIKSSPFVVNQLFTLKADNNTKTVELLSDSIFRVDTSK